VQIKNFSDFPDGLVKGISKAGCVGMAKHQENLKNTYFGLILSYNALHNKPESLQQKLCLL
jgi:hypothetical protein